MGKELTNEIDALNKELKIYEQSPESITEMVRLVHKAIDEIEKKNDKIKRQSNEIDKLEKEIKDQKKAEIAEKNSKSDQQRIEILERLGYGAQTEIEKSETREEKFRVPSLRFAEISKTPYEDVREEIENIAEEIKRKYGITVKLVEDIDIKNNPKEKFYILLEDNNGNTTTIDLLRYQENIYNYEVDEEESIKNEVVKLKGAYTADVVAASKKIANYISLALGYKETFHYQYKYIGWDKVDDEEVFKYDTIYSNAKIKREGFCGEEWAEAIGTKEYKIDELNKREKDKVLWNEMMAITFNDSVVADIILCAAVSGIIRQKLTPSKENNINMNIVGEKSSGKTTMENLVLSFYGNPERLLGSHIDTDNASEQIRVERAIIPYILDERMLKVETDGSKKKALIVLMSIFKEYEGRVKSRVGSQYTNSSRHSYGAIISSSVESIFEVINKEYANDNVLRDLGQYRRFIEVNAKKGDLFRDGEHAKAADNIAHDRYGFGVEQIINFMLELPQYMYYYFSLIDIDSDNKMSTSDILDILGYIKKTVENQDITVDEKRAFALKLEYLYGDNQTKYDDILTLLIDDHRGESRNEDEKNANIFDVLYNKVLKEIGIKLNEYGQDINEMESSDRRFALLVLTGLILNYSIETGDERLQFNMDMDAVADYLITNLYEKLQVAGVINREKEEKEVEETYSKEDYLRRVIEIYDWIISNREFFYEYYSKNDVRNNKIDKYIGRITEDTTSIKVALHEENGIQLRHAIFSCENDAEAVLVYKEQNENVCKFVKMDFVDKVMTANKKCLDYFKIDTITINKKTARGVEIIFYKDEIEQLRKELQSQEESANETN